MIKKKITCIIVVVLAIVLQTTVFQNIALADVVPNIMLVVTVTYGYLRGRTSGLLVGFFCGLLLDMYCGSVIGLYAFALMTIGFFVGFCQKIYFTNNLILPIILIASSDLLYGIYVYITEFLMRGKLYFGFAFVYKILPELIYTVIIGIIVYRLLAALEEFLSKSKEEEA